MQIYVHVKLIIMNIQYLQKILINLINTAERVTESENTLIKNQLR